MGLCVTVVSCLIIIGGLSSILNLSEYSCKIKDRSGIHPECEINWGVCPYLLCLIPAVNGYISQTILSAQHECTERSPFSKGPDVFVRRDGACERLVNPYRYRRASLAPYRKRCLSRMGLAPLHRAADRGERTTGSYSLKSKEEDRKWDSGHPLKRESKKP